MIQSFKISTDEYLFFDIFHKNNVLYLICPLYQESINETLLTIYGGDTLLNYREKHSRVSRESTEIVLFDYVTDSLTMSTVKVIYNGNEKKYELPHIQSKPCNNISITTLFKNDYNLISIFYDYYRKQGVTNFYMYYNGKLTDDIKTKYNLPGITLVEWDFRYWVHGGKFSDHHAQPGQMHHALYRYCKDFDEYLIFCDLDEYLYIPNTTLSEYFKSNPTIDMFGFKNVWADTLDETIPTEFPSKVSISSELFTIGYRSKFAYRVDSISTVYIHIPSLPHIKDKWNISNIMLHFYKWSGKNRIITLDKELDLKF
jgi:hypothetical protein